MGSKETTRDTISSHLEYVPTPLGCTACFTREDTSYWRRCQHTEHLNRVREEFHRRNYRWLGVGAFRETFTPSKASPYVYKVPLNQDGFYDNYYEALASMERDRLYSTYNYRGIQKIGHRVARCSLHASGVLVMEKLRDPATYGNGLIDRAVTNDPSLDNDLAANCLWDMDGGQGGFDRNGKFKLYDFTHGTKIDNTVSNIEAL